MRVVPAAAATCSSKSAWTLRAAPMPTSWCPSSRSVAGRDAKGELLESQCACGGAGGRGGRRELPSALLLAFPLFSGTSTRSPTAPPASWWFRMPFCQHGTGSVEGESQPGSTTGGDRRALGAARRSGGGSSWAHSFAACLPSPVILDRTPAQAASSARPGLAEEEHEMRALQRALCSAAADAPAPATACRSWLVGSTAPSAARGRWAALATLSVSTCSLPAGRPCA